MLLRRAPDAAGYLAWRALFLQHQGENALKSGLIDQSERDLKQSIDIWNQQIDSHRNERISWHALPIAYRILSRAQRRLEKHAEAEESLKQAEMSRIYRDITR